jgi:hypothetical protein
LAIAAQPCDLFAEFVNRGTKGVTLSRNISQSSIKRGGFVDLLQKKWRPTPC